MNIEIDVFGFCTACIVGALLCVLIKKYSPEHSFLVSCAVVCTALIYLVPRAGTLLKEIGGAVGGLELGGDFACIVKVAGIGIVTQLAGDICRDAGQSSVAGAIELCGRLGALAAVFPMFLRLLKTVTDLMR